MILTPFLASVQAVSTDSKMQSNKTQIGRTDTNSGLTDAQRRLMLLDDIKHELKRGNEQRAEMLALLRAAVDTEETEELA